MCNIRPYEDRKLNTVMLSTSEQVNKKTILLK